MLWWRCGRCGCIIDKTLHKTTKIICKENMPLIIAITFGRLQVNSHKSVAMWHDTIKMGQTHFSRILKFWIS